MELEMGFMYVKQVNVWRYIPYIDPWSPPAQRRKNSCFAETRGIFSAGSAELRAASQHL